MDPANGLDLDTSVIRQWRSIVTLIVFVVTNIIVLFPFYIPIYVPRPLWTWFLGVLSWLRIVSPRHFEEDGTDGHYSNMTANGNTEPTIKAEAQNTAQRASKSPRFKVFRFHMNFVTAPLVADLFLLAIMAIEADDVHAGVIGVHSIYPIDIMAFFLTLAYIAISIDASGLIRYLAFKILQKGGKFGRRLYFYLYAFFYGLASIVGNDPIILSGTAFLAYMTRISNNIEHPRAWIHMQFTLANVGSAILVSSNPTNLVLAGAFKIKYIDYAANVVVPVVITALLLFPFLLYIVFPYESLIPSRIELHELPQDRKDKKPVNPNIPHADAEVAEDVDDEQTKMAHLEEIMNPFLDKGGAGFGAVVMATTLVTILAVNASSARGSEVPIYWITCPAAFVMCCWDLIYGWRLRKETRAIARTRQKEVLRTRAERIVREAFLAQGRFLGPLDNGFELELTKSPDTFNSDAGIVGDSKDVIELRERRFASVAWSRPSVHADESQMIDTPESPLDETYERRVQEVMDELEPKSRPATVSSLMADGYRWMQETFPTATTVVTHLPWKLIPFAFCMFVLVQALVTKGWVPVFAHGWDHWVTKTGTIGAVGGMAFLSVVLCNFAGTNIGTTILLCRVIQAWVHINTLRGDSISDRTFSGTVYSMAIGVNYGAFSTAFSASLAGLLWRDILARKHIVVREWDFARVNLPIIAFTMTIACLVLIAEIYIVRGENAMTLIAS